MARCQHYYASHPEVKFVIKKAYVPLGKEKSEKEQIKEINEWIRRKEFKKFKWEKPYSVMLDELSENKKFIAEMKPGEVSKPVKVGKTFEVIRLVEKKERSLEDRYREIDSILKEPKYNEMLAEYKKSLLDNASVSYLSEELKPKSS